MKCSRLKKYFIPYIEGDLETSQANRLEDHIASCGSCARELDDLRGTLDMLRSTQYPAMQPASDMRRRIESSIQPRSSPHPSFGLRLKLYAAAGTALIIFCAAIINIAPMFVTKKSVQSSGDLSAYKQMEARDKGTAGRDELPAEPEKQIQYEPAPMNLPHESGSEELRSTSSRRTQNTLMQSKQERDNSIQKGKSDIARSGTGIDEDRSDMYREDKQPEEALPPGSTVTGFASEALSAGDEHVADAGQASPGAGRLKTAPSAECSEKPAQPAHSPADLGVHDAQNIAAERKISIKETKTEDRVLVLEKKLKELPKSRAVMLELLEAYKQAGRAKDEYAIAERLTELEPENAAYWFALGQAAERAMKPQVAVAAYHRAEKEGLSGADLDLAKRRIAVLEAPDR